MSTNSIEEFSAGLQGLPSEAPPDDMLDRIRSRIQKRNAVRQQFRQFGAVSCVALIVIGVVVWNEPALDELDPFANGLSNGNELAMADENNALQSELLGKYSPSIIAKSAIVLRLAEVNTELEQLRTGDSDRRDQLLEQKDELKKSYRFLRDASDYDSQLTYNGYL